MPNKKSSGIADIISYPLSNYINESFVTGTFPDKLKIAKVVQIHKKGKKEDINNYRPFHFYRSFLKYLKN